MRGQRRLRSGALRRRSRAERGASAVEFALILPVLLLVVFGIITWGLIFAAQISLNSAARDAARNGVVQPFGGTGATCSAIATAARGSVGTVGLTPANVKVVVTSPVIKTGTTPYSCTMPAGSSTATGDTTTQMCTGSGNTGQLGVTLYYTANSPVPLVPPKSIDLSGQGSFQCEYN